MRPPLLHPAWEARQCTLTSTAWVLSCQRGVVEICGMLVLHGLTIRASLDFEVGGVCLSRVLDVHLLPSMPACAFWFDLVHAKLGASTAGACIHHTH